MSSKSCTVQRKESLSDGVKYLETVICRVVVAETLFREQVHLHVQPTFQTVLLF